MKNGYKIFVVSFFVAMLFTGFERTIGLNTGFHPDSLYYLANYGNYVRNIDSFSQSLNNFYFFVVHVADGSELSLLLLNWLLFGLTNCVIFRFVGEKINPLVLILMFLPYRLHLSAHILKDTIVIFLCLLPFIMRGWWSGPIGLILAGFRIPALPVMFFARFMPKNSRIVVLSFASLIMVIATVDWVYSFLLDRSATEMGGRDYFDIPLADASSFGAITLKSIVWPFFYKTGTYAIVSTSPILIGLAIEQIVLFLLALRAGFIKNYILGRGTLALAVYALLVNSFGAYYRYGYAFYILDAMVVAQLWNLRLVGTQHATRVKSALVARAGARSPFLSLPYHNIAKP